MKLHGICDLTLNYLIPYIKFEYIKKGNYYIKKEEDWKKVSCILSGRLIVKLNENPIPINEIDNIYNFAEKKENYFYSFDDLILYIGNNNNNNNPISPEIIEKLKLHLDTPEKILNFRNNLLKINSEKIDKNYIRKNPLKNPSYNLANKKICK